MFLIFDMMGEDEALAPKRAKPSHLITYGRSFCPYGNIRGEKGVQMDGWTDLASICDEIRGLRPFQGQKDSTSKTRYNESVGTNDFVFYRGVL